MHVVINAQLLNTAHTYRGAGVSNYSQNLLSALGQAGSRHRFTAFLSDPAFQAEGVTLVRTRWPAHLPPARILWEQTALPWALRRQDAALVHGLVNVLPLATSVPGVVTVHDLSFIHMPEKFPPAKRFYLERLCRASAARARRIIAVSRQTADDLVRCFGVKADRIEVVYNGVAAHFRPEADRVEMGPPRSLVEVDRPFLLYVGTLEPRKNLVRLVEAFARWRQGRPSAREVQLVLAGAKGWYYEEIFQQVQALELQEVVRFPGFIPTEELPGWYRAAAAFVYPSLFEGFGLPVVEAMACGTPVICSDAASLREVAGDAALIAPAEDVDAWVAGLDAFFTQPGLADDLRRRGLERASRFTWERAAAETIAVYEAAVRAERR
ncbi:MAG: glycosyltransferase family 1 protein [Caldilineae bacterium]|nr:MAG: glycosyltransferase family 1 protein [Caldilineae bacterium]